MTVTELIERLKTLPKDAEVHVKKDCDGYYESLEFRSLENDDIYLQGNSIVELGN